jgi:O-antigen/teichoic acid export membrane protein
LSFPLGGDPAAAALRSAGRGFRSTVTSQGVIKLAALAFGIWVARQLGASELGRYSAALAFAGLFGVATGPGAASFGSREMAADRSALGRLVADIAALRLALATGIVPLVVLVAWGLGRRGDALVAVAVAALGLPLYALANTLDAALVSQGRLDLASACAAARQALFVVFGTLALLFGGGAVALLLAACLAAAARAAITFLALRRATGARLERPRPRRWAGLAWRGLPFGVEAVADIAGLHLPMIGLTLCASDDAVLGFFGAAFYLVLAALPLAQGAGAALVPALNAPGGRELLPRITGTAVRWAAASGLAAALLVSALAGPLVARFYGPAYDPAAGPLRVLAWALPLMLVWEVLRAAALALRREAAVGRVAVCALLAEALALATLAPALGATGAALAFVALRLASVGGLAFILAQSLSAGEARLSFGLAAGERA